MPGSSYELGYLEGGNIRIKVMTYNIHHGRGIDKRFSIKRIAEVIENENPDIVSINEADKYNIRSWFIDEPAKLSNLLGMDYFFGDNVKILFMKYGNVVLTKLPILNAENILLPASGEQRGVVKAKLSIEGQKMNILCTHLSLSRKMRELQFEQIRQMVTNSSEPSILAGDFNCKTEELNPLFSQMQPTEGHYTYSATRPTSTLDYIVWTKHFEILNSYSVDSKASDHLPLVALLKLKTAEN